MSESICKFIPVSGAGETTLETVRFILEKDASVMETERVAATYRLGLATDGLGELNKDGVSYPLRRGDMFFVFPGELFRILDGGGLAYMYIDFIGLRASYLAEKLDIRKNAPVYPAENEFLMDLWLRALEMSAPGNLGLVSEGALLFAFSLIENKSVLPRRAPREDTSIRLQKYINAYFSDPELTLSRICKEFSYDKKYISSIFPRKLGVSFSRYLNTVRLQHACFLMERGYSEIKEIARLSGFRDPLYFSKRFKLETGLAPSEWIRGRKSHD